MAFYQTRTVVRDCEQWTGDNAEYLAEKFGLDILFSWGKLGPQGVMTCSIWVAANKEWLSIELDEWIIKDSHGIYPCKDDVFHEKYEELK